MTSKDGWFLPRSALNEPQIATLERFLSHARRAHEIDCKVRKDAVETWYQFDFIKHLEPRGGDAQQVEVSKQAQRSPHRSGAVPDPEAEKRRILTMLGYDPDDPSMSVQLVTATETEGVPPAPAPIDSLIHEVMEAVELWGEVPPPTTLAETEECARVLLRALHDPETDVRIALVSLASVVIWHIHNLIDRAK